MEKYKIIAITACSSGIAHTYMAAESLSKAGLEMGIEIHVETQGTIGIENKIPDDLITEAFVLISATDIKIDYERFKKIPIYNVGVGVAIKNPRKLIEDAIEFAKQNPKNKEKKDSNSNFKLGKVKQKGILNHLMTGVSWMLPLTVASGLLLAIANVTAFKNEYVDNFGEVIANNVMSEKPFSYFLNTVGSLGFKLMIPIFAAFIAYSIADRPGICPALIGGWLINDNVMLGIDIEVSSSMSIQPGAGFLGAIVVGLMSGYFVKILKSVHWPQWLKPVVPILIIPLISTIVVTSIIKFAIGVPIAEFMLWMFDGLSELQKKFTASSIIIGIVLAIMIGFDLGGPINKTAAVFADVVLYQTLAQAFAIGGSYWDADFVPQTAVCAAFSVPPLGMWLSTIMFKKKYTKAERNMNSGAFGTGIVGITEGAIPYAATDPIRVIFATAIGSGVAGGLVTLFKVKMAASISSPIGSFVGIIKQDYFPFWPLAWTLPVLIGVLTVAIIAGLIKKRISQEEISLLIIERRAKKEKRIIFWLNFKLLFTNPKIGFKRLLNKQEKYWKVFRKNFGIWFYNGWLIIKQFFWKIAISVKMTFVKIKNIFNRKNFNQKQTMSESKLKIKEEKKLTKEKEQLAALEFKKHYEEIIKNFKNEVEIEKQNKKIK